MYPAYGPVWSWAILLCAASAAAHGRLPEWPKGAVCKTVGSAYVGSNPTPATPARTALHQHGYGEGLLPSRSGCVRLKPAVYGWPGRMRGEVSPVLVLAVVVAEGIFDPLAVDLVPSVDALGVDPHQHLHRVACPLGDLGRVHPGVEPRGQAGVPQVIRPPRERRGFQGRSECEEPGALPHAAVDAFGQVPATLAAEQPAIRGGAELADVPAQVPGQGRMAGHRAHLALGAVFQFPGIAAPPGPGE